jgi:hypothetical protein
MPVGVEDDGTGKPRFPVPDREAHHCVQSTYEEALDCGVPDHGRPG